MYIDVSLLLTYFVDFQQIETIQHFKHFNISLEYSSRTRMRAIYMYKEKHCSWLRELFPDNLSFDRGNMHTLDIY